MDHMRFDSVQTRFFGLTLLLVCKLDLSWDGVSVQDLVFATVLGRTKRAGPVPVGAKWARDQVGQIEGFRELLDESGNYRRSWMDGVRGTPQ
jgi:hypothetical protein